MFPSFPWGKHCFQCQFLCPRCKLCLRHTAGKFSENPSMRAVAKISRARASEHSSNFCEQFEQRPNFAKTYKLDGTIRYPCIHGGRLLTALDFYFPRFFFSLLLTYKAIHGLAPPYISDLIRTRERTNYNLRSSSQLLLQPYNVTKTKKTLGDRAFQVASPGLWNSLPNDIRNAKTMDVFKSLVKTYLFRKAYACYF